MTRYSRWSVLPSLSCDRVDRDYINVPNRSLILNNTNIRTRSTVLTFLVTGKLRHNANTEPSGKGAVRIPFESH